MNNIQPGDITVECAQAGDIGFLIYGQVKCFVGTLAIIEINFRDDNMVTSIPIKEVRLPHQDCHTCIHRLSHVVTGGRCPAKYESLEESFKA
jgi:hypothetical protein